MSQTIPVEYRDLFHKRAFASLGTLGSNGSARVTPVWCDLEGEFVLLNTAKGRHQDKNIRRDGRIALVIVDPDNPYRYLEIRGNAVETFEQDAVVHLDKMAKKYLGADQYPYKHPGEERVMYKIEAEHIHGHNFPHAEWL
jgi:PPOX class probable F420-dependent enzyme